MAKENTVAVSRALRPRARILRTLGEELISSEIVAVIELVKNAYDADAGTVLVRFDGDLQEGHGTVTVEDNGHGMRIDVVEKAWMEPATNFKKKAKTSQYLKRRLLGEKGVGRFAAARLAADLELCTRAAETEEEVYAYFDWSQFDNESLYLDEVLILAEEREPIEFTQGRQRFETQESGVPALPRDGTHGTLLRMNHLKKTWGERELKELNRGLSRLVSPFEGLKTFRIMLLLPGQSIADAVEVEPPEVIKYPHYSMSGNLQADGQFEIAISLFAAGETHTSQGYLSRESKDSPLVETDATDVSSIGLVCGPLSFELLVWDRDQLDNVLQKLGTGIRSIRRDLDSIAGVSIYRDGFRVLPYGEPENDWLKLDLRRVQNPTLRLSNNQITGYVRISADANPLLRDQSNREGLDNNQAYADLQDYMKFSLAKLEQLRFKQKQARSNEEDTEDQHPLLESPNTEALREKLTELGSDEALEMLESVSDVWATQIVRVREVLSRYHSLATLGQLVDKVVHDGRQPLATLQTQTTLARESIEKVVRRRQLEDECKKLLSGLDERLSKIQNASGLIDLLIKRIEPLGGRRKGRPTKVYLKEIVNSALSHYTQEIEGLGIRVELPDTDDLIQVDDLEIQEVFINLIANSVFWLKEVPRSERAIVVQWSRPTSGELDIIFADSGPGIPKANRKTIFEPYFSTKPDGVGLGLVIAGEIVRDYYDGALELLDSGPLSGAAFRIKLRKRV